MKQIILRIEREKIGVNQNRYQFYILLSFKLKIIAINY